MKNFKHWVGMMLLATLSACGGDDVNNTLPITTAGLGACGAPPGVKDKTVVGSLGGGATITLDIYSQPAGTVAAIGEIIIPSVASLYDPSNGGFLSYYGGGYGGFGGTAPSTVSTVEFRSCVSSNGYVGTIDRSSTYQNIEIALRGTNVYVELGSKYGVPVYLSGDAIQGTMRLDLNGQPSSLFALARP